MSWRRHQYPRGGYQSCAIVANHGAAHRLRIDTTQWPIQAELYTSGYISIQSVSATNDACYSNGQWLGGRPFVTYVVWTSFDGTRTILKDTKSNGQEQGAGVNSCTLQGYAQYDHGRVFRATDGSDLDQAANLIARRDHLPYGEEVAAGAAGRNGSFAASDGVSQLFTGQIRDSETRLDFFGARYFNGAQGGFNSPDPFNAGADPTDPQSWNAYGYVRGNPLNATDPTGMFLSALDPPNNGSNDGDCRRSVTFAKESADWWACSENFSDQIGQNNTETNDGSCV